jgi:ribonuclease HII
VTHKLRKAIRNNAPTLEYEKSLWAEGKEIIVGIDEVGKGAWAGPLTVGAAIVPKDKRLYRIRDSKLLNEEEREFLFGPTSEWCVAWGIGQASNDECDNYGMSTAQKIAARRAIEKLPIKPDHALIDGNWDFVGGLIGKNNVTKIVKGDAKCLSIATASILAKVTRDRIMREQGKKHSLYSFASNKGYPCPKHKKALEAQGPCELHRKSWAFMDQTRFPRAPKPMKDPMQGLLFQN